MSENKKYKLIFGICIIIEVALAVAAIVFMFKKQGSVGIENDIKLFCTVDMVCMLLSILFQVGGLMHFSKQHRFVFVAFIGELVGMAMDMFRRLMEGMPEYSSLHIICVVTMYVATITIVYATFMFITDTIVNVNNNYRLLIKIITIGYFASAAIRIGNIWFGYYSIIDESGNCINQNLYYLTAVFPVCIIFITVVVIFLSRMSRLNKSIIVVVYAISLVLGTLSDKAYNANVRYALFTIVSIVIYSIFFVEQRYYDLDRVRAFNGFLPQEVADKLIDSKTGEMVNGKRLNVTLMKIRLCDYYRITSGLTAEKKKLLFNSSMEFVISHVEKHKGIVLNYEGDGALCAFGVPDIDHAHGDNAIYTAFDIMNNLKEFNENNKKHDLPTIKISLGMFSGIALFTCLKAGEKNYYTAVTTMVDDCKRIASMAGKNQILIEQNTLTEISIPLKAIHVSKYRSENTLYPISLYEAKQQDAF